MFRTSLVQLLNYDSAFELLLDLSQEPRYSLLLTQVSPTQVSYAATTTLIVTSSPRSAPLLMARASRPWRPAGRGRAGRS
jgi:hypothetical protein